MPAEIVGVVKGWMTRPNGSLAVVIPRAAKNTLGCKGGDRFVVKVDEQRRIIYEAVGGNE